MTKQQDTLGLTAAYDLDGPDASRKLYRDWADTYDETFAQSLGYAYPQRIAELFDDRAADGDAPVLDVGCGTGLVGAALRKGPVDGLDISPEMLRVAADKGDYRNLFEGDLTLTLPFGDDVFGGFVSAGTFTHGHVGPDALDELTRIARRGALFVLGVNDQVYRELNFAQKLDGLVAAAVISEVEEVEGAIYQEGADHDHADDRFRALVFRRC